MNKNRLILAVIGGVIAVAVLVAAFLVWQAHSAKVAAREGDEEEGTDGLETVVNRAQTLSRKPIYPCAESVKASTPCSNLHSGDLVALDTRRGRVCELSDLRAEQKEFPHCIPDGIFVLGTSRSGLSRTTSPRARCRRRRS